MTYPVGEQPPPVQRRIWPAFVGVAAIAAVTGSAAVLLATGAFSGNDGSGTPPEDSEVGSGAVVRLQPVGYNTEEPFTESVVTVEEETLSEFAAALTSAGRETVGEPVVDGNAPRLYATRSGEPVCDVQRLAAMLTEDPAVTRSWAGASGIDPADVGDSVLGYTPVLLSFDTAVTNHSYGSDGASAFQSILQAGTPVLVDDRGVPRTQCSCGNPLGEPQGDSEAELVGDAWEGFDDAEVIQVQPTPEPTQVIDTLDIDDGATVETPTGGVVSLEGLLLAHGTGVDVVADDGTRTTVLDSAVETVVDDGAGGLIYTTGRTLDPHQYYSPPVKETDGVIWHLRAGATEPEPLTQDDGDPNTWDVLRGAGTLGDRSMIVYYSLAPDTEYASEGLVPHGPALLLELDTGTTEVLEEYGYGWETGTGPFSFGGDRLAYDRGYGYPDWQVRDADLNAIENICGGIDESWSNQDGLNDLDDRCPRKSQLDGDGRLVALTQDDPSSAAFHMDEVAGVRVMDPVTGEVITTAPLTLGYDATSEQWLEYDVWDGRIVINADPDDPEAEAIAVVTIGTAEVRELAIPGQARFLRAPLQRPRTPLEEEETATDPDTAAAAEPEITLAGIGEVLLGMDESAAIAAGNLNFEQDDVCTAEIDGNTTDDSYAMPTSPGTEVSIVTVEGSVFSFTVNGRWTTTFGVSSGDDISEIADRFRSEGWDVSISGFDDIFGEGRLEAFRGEEGFTIEPDEQGLASRLYVPRPIYCE